MLIGVGALAVGMRHRAAPGRAAAPAAISPLDSGPLSSFDSPGMFADSADSPRDVAPSVVRIEGRQQGAGVVVDGDGIVLTSADVVGNLPDVKVTFDDGPTLTGTNLGTDPVTNLAVVDLPGDGFAAARMLAAAELSPDDTVLCAGVDGDGFRTIVGTVAATRTAHSRESGTTLDGVIKITPSSVTSPQRLGCAVIDASGAVLAVTTSNDSLWYYATPIEVAREVGNDVLETGAAQHAWIGIRSSDTDGEPGVELTEVDDRGPAAGALRAGDVITELDGTPVAEMSALVSLLQAHDPGDEVEIAYERDGEPHGVTVQLAPARAAVG